MQSLDNPKALLQEEEYRLPIHWILKRAGLKIYLQKTYVIASLLSDIMQPDAQVLDVGCGDGRGTAELARMLPNFKFIGIDFSERAISFARLMAPNITFEVQDGSKLPYKDASFEIIVAREVIEHVPPEQTSDFVAEIARVLKEQGAFLITTPSINRRLPVKHYQHFTVSMLEALLSQNGLYISRVIGFGYWPPRSVEQIFRFIVGLPAMWRIHSFIGTLFLHPSRADNLIVLAKKASSSNG